MPVELLRSQFDALEEPQDGITVDISFSPAQIASGIVEQLDNYSNQEAGGPPAARF
jgi:gluconate kinase